MAIAGLVDWLVIGCITILFAAQITLLALRYYRRELRAWWLTAFSGLALAWPVMALARLGIPKEIQLGDWQLVGSVSQGVLSSSPVFLLDQISWVFSLAIISLGTAVIMTAVFRLAEGTWRSWLGTLALTTLGVMAALAGNPLTLIFAWTALDFVEFAVWNAQPEENVIRNQVYASFMTRFAGTLVLIVMTLVSTYRGIQLTFDNIPQQFTPFLMLALVLRLGIFPLHAPLLTVRTLSLGTGTMLRMIPLSAIFVLLARVAGIGVPSNWILPLLYSILLVFVFSAFQWFISKDEIEGRPYWAVSAISMSLLAVVLAQPIPGLAWGVTIFLVSGLLFISSYRSRSLYIIPVLSGLSLTMLPFSPTWQVTSLFTWMVDSLSIFEAIIAIPLGLLGLSLFVLGFLRHGLRIEVKEPQPERWMWLLYLPGIALLLFVNFALSWIDLPDFNGIGIVEWILGVIVCFISAGILVYSKRISDIQVKQNSILKVSTDFLNRVFSFQWAFELFTGLYRVLKVLYSILSAVLEGEGGLLWSYLFLLMLLSLAFQIGLVR